jgi:hypothetical protein
MLPKGLIQYSRFLRRAILLTLPMPQGKGVLSSTMKLATTSFNVAVEVRMSLSVRATEVAPVPWYPQVRWMSIHAIEKPFARRVWRCWQPSQHSYALYRNFSCSANFLTASSSTADWLIPRCFANRTIKSFASWLIRMLINAFCISQLYHKLRYTSRGYYSPIAQAPLKDSLISPCLEGRGFTLGSLRYTD